MLKHALKGLLLCSLSMAGSLQAATPSGEMLANTCVGCHGPNGISVGPATPSIAGISSEYFIESMLAYREGERPSTIMTRIAKGYNDEEIEAMAAFYADEKFVAAPQAYDKKAARKGANLHDKYCEKCHGEGGSSTEDDSGILAGQWMPYLHYTLNDFTSGNREMEKGMRKNLKKLQDKRGEEGLKQLMQFYASKK